MEQQQGEIKKNCLFIISGPSGAGKSTIITEILKQNFNCSLSISCTTRGVRGAEKHGIDYFFISNEEFEKKIKDEELLEHATVHGNSYGTPKSFILEALKEKNVILDIDYQGMEKIKSNNKNEEIEIVTIFVLPPSYKDLSCRLNNRGTDKPEDISKRMAGAKKEIKQCTKYDYVIVNDDKKNAISLVHKIINSKNKNNEELKNNLPSCEEIQNFLKKKFFFKSAESINNNLIDNRLSILV